MASRKVDINITTKADTSGANQAAVSMEKLDAASNKAATGAANAARGTSRVGTIASQAGFQVQDFAVQVGGGTSALVAMSQQAPQFLGVFGPAGRIAGALIAVGGIAAKVFMDMADDSASAAEKAALLTDAVEQIGENAGKAVAKDIDFGLSQIVAAAEQAENLIGVYDRITQAQNASATAGLSNLEKLREAELELARLRGEQVDEFAAISSNAEADRAARELAAQQQIAAQNEQLAKAQQREAIAQKLFLAAQSQATQAELQRQAETRTLEILRAQRDALAEQAKERGKLSEGEIPFLKTGAAVEAQRQLDDPAFRAKIAATEARVNDLDAQLAEEGGKLTEAVTTAGQALAGAQRNTAIVAETLATEIPKIEQTLQAENIVAQVDAIKEVATQAATEVQGIIDQVKPANAAEAAALEALKPMVADKQITANETLRVSQLLGTLDGSIRTQMGTAAANTDKLIQTVAAMQQRLDNQQKKIDALQANARAAGS